MEKISFNKPFIAGKELYYIAQAVQSGHLSGDGVFTKKCHAWLEEHMKTPRVLLTHSCTAALEMAAILCDIHPGDEFIVPSYTFVSTVNAFVLRGGIPVFVDIRPDTMNIDERKIESAISARTKVIVPVHYAGVGAEMDAIMDIARRHSLLVVEDAAQGVDAYYHGKALGTIGDLGCFSFHETKNFISGEGGAIAINNPCFLERAEIIREKGTNRSQFFRGMVDKYTWVDIGSSYLPSEVVAAFLYAQLEESTQITQKRLSLWQEYYSRLQPLESRGLLRLPVIPDGCRHNAHMFYILLRDLDTRSGLIDFMKSQGILPVFHYVPLHKAPKGLEVTGKEFSLPVTEEYADRLLRLPMYYELDQEDVERITRTIEDFLLS